MVLFQFSLTFQRVYRLHWKGTAIDKINNNHLRPDLVEWALEISANTYLPIGLLPRRLNR